VGSDLTADSSINSIMLLERNW